LADFTTSGDQIFAIVSGQPNEVIKSKWIALLFIISKLFYKQKMFRIKRYSELLRKA
jgi:hypothetical protein